ncbi:MAG: UDP-N-acetylmuramoyl-tripeptide--D-alanyl-D-alanine ligase [Gemmatimonadota bacterium]
MSRRLTDAWIRAALHVEGGTDLACTAVVTDSREMVPGALFVALVGERFDAHQLLDAARDAGAAAAVVRDGTPDVPGLRLYRVPDTLVALGDLASAARREQTGPVIGITGQNGKTSTKEMVAAVLGTRWATHKTRANLNNLIGVPRTILEAPEGTEALVVEAGANLPGEIARYREIIAPDISILTNAGAGHLEGFGSVAGVVREKLELTRDVPLAIVGTVPAELAPGARERGAARVLTAGLEHADVVPDSVLPGPDGRPIIAIDGQTFTLAARGRHQAGNAMFAWAVARELGLDLRAAARALESFSVPGGRGELAQHGALTLLNDSYNANPQSFRSAIELARELRPGRRLVFVAGTMRELGAESTALHREIAGELATLEPELLALVGDFVPAFAPWREQFRGRLLEAPDAEAMGPLLAGALRGDELLVLKGSRGVTLERILPAILPRAATNR